MVEAAKGAIVLVIGFGLLSFLGRDAEDFAEHLVNRLHLNPAHHYPQIFIQAMSDVTDSGLWMLAGLAAAKRLQELPYVGDVIETVITEALASQVPAYLQRLEAEQPDIEQAVGLLQSVGLLDPIRSERSS